MDVACNGSRSCSYWGSVCCWGGPPAAVRTRPLQASAGDRAGERIVATGPVMMRYDDSTKTPIALDALYFLDHQGGRLLATVPTYRNDRHEDAVHRRLRRTGPCRRLQARPGRRRASAIPDDHRQRWGDTARAGRRSMSSRRRPARSRSIGCRPATFGAAGPAQFELVRAAQLRQARWPHGGSALSSRVDSGRAPAGWNGPGHQGRLAAAACGPSAAAAAAFRGGARGLGRRHGLRAVGPRILVVDQPFALGIEEIRSAFPGR